MRASPSMSPFEASVTMRFTARKHERASTASLMSSKESSALFAAPSPGAPGGMYKWKALPSLPNEVARSRQALIRSQSVERFQKVALWMAKADQAAKAPPEDISMRPITSFAYRESTPLPPTRTAKMLFQKPSGASLPAQHEAATFMAAPEPKYEPAGPTREELAARAKQKVKSTQFVQSASNALNSRFSDMFKAFQYVDLDRSGTLDKKEIARALDMWNIPIDHDKLDDLIAACDGDGDGQVDYKEFVDVLARDTVASAAMGKRDMQAQEAMGVADLDPEFLGHKKMKNVRASINADLFSEDTPAPKAKSVPTPAGPVKPVTSSAQVPSDPLPSVAADSSLYPACDAPSLSTSTPLPHARARASPRPPPSTTSLVPPIATASGHAPPSLPPGSYPRDEARSHRSHTPFLPSSLSTLLLRREAAAAAA